MKRSIILFSIIIYFGACTHSEKNQNTSLRKSSRLKVGANEIHYQEQGQGDTTLLFIHGWCIDGTYWNEQLHYFSEQYRCIALDLPGFGKSTAERTDWTLESYGEDVSGLIDHLKLQNVILIGHSMSGEVALEVALKNKPSVVGMVGIDNFNNIDVVYSEEEIAEMTAFFEMLKKDFQNMAPAYAENTLFIAGSDSTAKTRVKADFARANPAVAISSLNNLIQYGMQESAKLGQLNYKLYLLNSADLGPTHLQGLEKNCKRSFEVSYIQGTGHYPMIERPREFNELLADLLKKI